MMKTKRMMKWGGGEENKIKKQIDEKNK